MSLKAKLSILRGTRGRIKGSLTKLASFTEKLVETVSLEALEVRVEKVDELWDEFKTTQNAMYEFSEEEDYIDPDPECEEVESKCLVVKSVLLAAIRERKTTQPKGDAVARLPEQQATATVQARASNSAATSQSQHVETPLPTIRIEPFSGNYRDWPTFRDMFEGSVHNRTNLSPTQKFHLLKSNLRGDALNLLNHITISDATYDQAWERIEKRYNKPRHIINNFVKNFFDLPSIVTSNVSILRRISDGADEIVRGLTSINSLDRDPWLIHILLNKVDPETRQAWSEYCVDEDYPTMDFFLTFLERRCEALETCRGHTRESNRGKHTTVKSMHASSSLSCPRCSESHSLSQCTDFLALDIQAKRDFVKLNKLCFNCLRSGHTSARCQSKSRCKTCNTRHHSLVHSDSVTVSISTNSPSGSTHEAQPSTSLTGSNFGPPLPTSSRFVSHSSSERLVNNHSLSEAHRLPQTLLPTAIGNVLDSRDRYQQVRFLLDSGSQVSFVSESCAQRLGLKRRNARILICGIGTTSAGKSRGMVSMCIASRYGSSSISVDAYVLPRVTANLPTVSFNIDDWDHIRKLDLADHLFNQSSPIDILLGADKVWDILQGEVRYSEQGYPIAQRTVFGWVLAGSLTHNEQQNIHSHHSIFDVDSILQAFWTIEEVDPQSYLSKEERDIEEHFLRTHQRDEKGKYIVDLPFKIQPSFAHTMNGAINRLMSMERKFKKNESLRNGYTQFLEEYLSLGHMRKIDSANIARTNVFYLPHHAVLKPDSSSTKLRVVFDGSFKDATGRSLNDLLMVGPPIQRNLFSVCLRFRQHKFVFTADIIKMFRQIWVSEKDRDFQRIVWRSSPMGPLEHYQLCTVTYGTSCAPFLSVRVLEQLAKDYEKEFPVAAEIVQNDFYVDDVVTGADTLEEALDKKNSLIKLLSKGGLTLSKWQSNRVELLKDESEKQGELIPMDTDGDPWVKVLGLYWNSKMDYFSFRFNLTPDECVITKRQILRDVASIFDPLGFLAPSVILLKIIFQELWHRKLEWDETVPDCIATQWIKYRQEFPILTKVAIPRSIGLANQSLQLHGFSDASAAAYAAVIYARFPLPNGLFETRIVAAKTRVAPLKQLSIPRLELCAALLLSRLIEAVQKALKVTFQNVFAWSDSQVFLSWVSSPPRRWDIFIGNRTSEILNTIPRSRWFHIRSEHNPADCASRGLPPSKLLEHPIWWHGPHWLQHNVGNWPVVNEFKEHPDCLLEQRKHLQHSLVVTKDEHPFESLSTRFSSWIRLIRSVAYIFRFISKSRKTTRTSSLYLKAQELRYAKLSLLKWVQNVHFGSSVAYFEKYGTFPKTCKILNLNPFLDEDKLLRVGGRIEEATVSYNAKHPIIIPKQHCITRLILLDAHERFLHPGVSTLFVLIRQEYWIIGCRNLLRKISHECIRCFRQKKATATQIMGNLPPPRVQQCRPFAHCGCDYAGPIAIKTKLGRKCHFTKAYISLFVCMVTKAIHLELVSDLTTDAFLAAFRRFVARRGKPSHMYSDNGTNFRGSARTLSEMHNLVLSENHNSLIEESLARDGITWHFIPPSAPHFGGLWEAGIKSVKYHLRSVIGDDALNFEDLYTFLSQVEAILNSRPLCQLSDNDIDPLTPAHFFLGEPYTAVPEPSLDLPVNRLSSWQSIQAKVQGYWKRWSLEYLTSLQNRPKWQQTQRDLQIDDLVLVKDSNLPPGKWLMGRVLKTHPGKDGRIRVVTLKTANGSFIRPIHKLAVLPSC